MVHSKLWKSFGGEWSETTQNQQPFFKTQVELAKKNSLEHYDCRATSWIQFSPKI